MIEYCLMGVEAWLEKAGVLKHKFTSEELDTADLKRRVLTVQYLQGKLPLDEYRKQLDQLPSMDFRALAEELDFKENR